MWYAKPSGGYPITSVAGQSNINEIWQMFNAAGYTKESASGALGNVSGESGFNPWRWQRDRVSLSAGYGLFQYTPASGYINLSGTTPNMSVTEQTAGATPEDGARQVRCFLTNELSKWVSSAWRPYWSQTTYSDLYAKRAVWLQQFGDGSRISMTQFARVTDIEAATFFFLACFEGPSVPALSSRYNVALRVYRMLGGDVPPEPPTPPEPPEPPTGKKKSGC